MAAGTFRFGLIAFFGFTFFFGFAAGFVIFLFFFFPVAAPFLFAFFFALARAPPPQKSCVCVARPRDIASSGSSPKMLTVP